MSNFKTYVLDFALNQVNQFTDITAEYEQIKKGRTIEGFKFKFKQKNNKEKPNTIKNVTYVLTDAQRYMFAEKLSVLPEMSEFSQGTESYKQFAVRIAEMLKESSKVERLLPMLEKVGYKKI